MEVEGEVREKEARVKGRQPETEVLHGLPQEQSIFNNMQHNHQPDSDRFCDSTEFTLFFSRNFHIFW